MFEGALAVAASAAFAVEDEDEPLEDLALKTLDKKVGIVRVWTAQVRFSCGCQTD